MLVRERSHRELRARPVDDERVNHFVRHAVGLHSRPLRLPGTIDPGGLNHLRKHCLRNFLSPVEIPILHDRVWATMVTIIQLRPETKARLDGVKIHPRESYDEVLNRLLDMVHDPEPLGEETTKKIEEGIRRHTSWSRSPL